MTDLQGFLHLNKCYTDILWQYIQCVTKKHPTQMDDTQDDGNR